jgi:hypothetical protein
MTTFAIIKFGDDDVQHELPVPLHPMHEKPEDGKYVTIVLINSKPNEFDPPSMLAPAIFSHETNSWITLTGAIEYIEEKDDDQDPNAKGWFYAPEVTIQTI